MIYQAGTGLRVAARITVLAVLALGLAGCGSTSKTKSKSQPSHINTKTKFSVSEYGVAASPRITTAKRPKKGGGRAFVGKPYRVRGKWYKPQEDPDYDKAGLASWYGPNFHGRLTANGEIYDQFHLSAAHPTFPLPSYARVTNKKNGNSVIVRVNDRGPYAHGRIIDVSNQAAALLDMKTEGVAAVRVEYVGRAPVEGDDTRYLMASYRPGGSGAPAEGVIATGVMMAMNAVDSALPGVAGIGSGLVPPAGVASAPQPALASAAFASVTGLPPGFALPSIGPVLLDRPSFGTPMAALEDTDGLRDVGMAFWGGRVVAPQRAFDVVLGGRAAER
ncbi:septal ring lytic transglycosylase RlpA family protein [Hoeflea ulvae]|uniref:Endolytic peptidoglycan transglycosylase RlpA n=1 Tax=Hoeflea ulvae TaxID=2983764 RepID=A0ABT3YGE0_9HYPH|nr:septal ring lytic transglycosylase RlpA family protein [Hoeflea ulvae]MCY0094976.1 septal ring lytic transglycosylase RlpA family protein [Hoeflea ulvae]